MSDQSFFKYLHSSEIEEREMAVHVLGNGLKFGEFSDTEKQEVVRALVAVLDDPSPQVRRTLSSVVVDIENVPYHLIHALSRDQFDVAKPIITYYQGLRESDLVDLVGQGNPVMCELIAARDIVPVTVSGAIAEIGERESCAVLLENPNANIACVSLSRLAERFGQDPYIRSSLIARDDLPLHSRAGLLSSLSNALNNLVVSRKWLPLERSRAAIHDACEKATSEYAGFCEDSEQRALVAHLVATGKLTAGILMRALVTGNIVFVAESLSLLAGVPLKRTYRLMRDRHGVGLTALFAKSGLPKPMYPGFSIAIGCVFESQREGLDFTMVRDRRRLVERIMTLYEEYSNDELDYLFNLLLRLSSEAALDDARNDFGWTLKQQNAA